MPVAVQQRRAPTAAESAAADPMTQLMQGLQVAQTVYGIKDARDKAELLRQQTELEKRKIDQADSAMENAGTLTPRDLLAHGKDYSFSDKESPNAVKLSVQDEFGDTNDVFATPRPKEKAVDPLAQQMMLERLDAMKTKKEEALKGIKLPATEAVALGSSNAAYKALEDASKAYDANGDLAGPWQGRLSGILGMGEVGDIGKRAKSFDAQMKLNAQNIGRSLEGGKLASEDIERYRAMLPNLTDSPDAARAKIAILQSQIAQKQAADQAALKQAGYNVGDIEISKAVKNPNIAGAEKAALQGITPEQARLELIRRKGLAGNLPKAPGNN